MNDFNSLKILCLAFWTPPLIRPRAILIGKLIPELVRQGIQPVMISYDNGEGWKPGVPVIKIKELKYDGNILTNQIKEHQYYHKIADQASKIIAEEKINLIFSFSNPQASNIIGALISQKTGIPFVSHFSDPWYDNPFKKFSILNGLKVKHFERFIVKQSTSIIFTNHAALKLVMNKYPAFWQTKAAVVPHNFDPDDYPTALGNNSSYIISYIGAFYRERNPEILFKSLRQIINRSDSVLNFKLRLIGATNDYANYRDQILDDLIKKYYLGKYIEKIPAVDFRTSLGYMMESDCLVVIDADFPNSPFLPSKLIDYAGSRKFIIGISPKGSPTHEFLEKLGGNCFSHDKEDEFAECLEKAITKQIKYNINEEFLAEFTLTNIAAKYKKIFNQCIYENR